MGATLELWPELAAQPRPVYSTFILTVSDAKHKVYGSAVTFYETFDEDNLTEEQCKLLDYRPGEGYHLHANKSICVLSHWPFSDAFEKWLLYLYVSTTIIRKILEINPRLLIYFLYSFSSILNFFYDSITGYSKQQRGTVNSGRKVYRPTHGRSAFSITAHFTPTKHEQSKSGGGDNDTAGELAVAAQCRRLQAAAFELGIGELPHRSAVSSHRTEDLDTFVEAGYSYSSRRGCVFVAVSVQVAMSLHTSLSAR